jgi:hypothetical protein
LIIVASPRGKTTTPDARLARFAVLPQSVPATIRARVQPPDFPLGAQVLAIVGEPNEDGRRSFVDGIVRA